MATAHLGMKRSVCLVILSAVVFLPGLGSSGRLSYHEAFVAQGAREILDSGGWWYPTIGGRPWLEKPPLPWWLTAALGRCAGGLDETVARLPSVLAATAMVLGVAVVAARHYGPGIGLLSGAVQATTAWTVMRGRLAEADMLLACLITWAIVAFDRMGDQGGAAANSTGSSSRWRRARWAFFVLWGTTALVKGIGFGAVLILAVTAAVVAWQRDGTAMRRLGFPVGWIVAAVLALGWPLGMVARHGFAALALWTMHVTDRLAAHPAAFAGERWWEYTLGLLLQAMPWAPLALIGAGRSLLRAARRRDGRTSAGPGPVGEVSAAVVAGDRLLWAWSAAPLALLALATVKNAHYAISAQVPWSIWAALGLVRLEGQLIRRGWPADRLRRRILGGCAGLALAYGLGFWLLGPWLDRRGVEWAFYESAARQLPPGAPLSLLYDDWDRNPYESPFGAFPHDLAVRLFYLNRPACWHFGVEALAAHPHADPGEGGVHRVPHEDPPASPTTRVDGTPHTPLYVIGRDRDLPALTRLGGVEALARGPSGRRDRTFALFRVAPPSASLDSQMPVSSKGSLSLHR
jgi:hypothetical protein